MALAAWAASAFAQPAPEPVVGWQPKPAVTAPRFMVVAAHPLAAAVGQDVLERGGNAMDAAVAVQMALNVVEPQSSGIGGGAFLLHYSARERRLRAYDGRETAPSAATPRLFLGEDGKPVRFVEALVGGRAVGTPGVVRMLEMAHRRHGSAPWASLFQPAIRLADDGFAVSSRLATMLARERFLQLDPNARKVFFDADGRAPAAGTALKQPELAATLRAIAARPDALYTGDIARDIATAVRERRGTLSAADIEAYRAIERAPLCRAYRAYRVCGSPPPSSGGVTVLQILGILESTPIAALAPDALMAAHLFAEAGRLAYADRDRYVADPGFVKVPLAAMLDTSYLATRAGLIDARRSIGRAAAGVFDGFDRVKRADSEALEVPATSHFSIVDRFGNAVSMTTSIEAGFGSRTMVRGFLLNNQLTDFSFEPEEAGARVANRVEAGKRPRSSMAPIIVFDRAGRVVFLTGSPGGNWIINFVARSLVAHLDWKLDAQAAVSLPYVGSRNGPTEIERARAAHLQQGLELLQHSVRVIDVPSGLHAIERIDGGWRGGADPRREGIALGG